MNDQAHVRESGLVVASSMPADSFKEGCLSAVVHKYRAHDLRREEPYEVIESEGNALVYGGASAFFDLLIGAANVTAYNNANAYLGVGTSATAFAATQTDLLGTDNRQGMEATYPQHTDGTGASNDSAVWKSSWATGDGNFAWAEWGLFNHATAGRMLQRKVESFGTKTSAAVWTLTVTLDLT